MKTIKLAFIAVAAVFLPLVTTIAEAATSVQNVKMQQRYPWNGLVDIDYEIVSDAVAETDFWIYFVIKDNDLNTTIAPRTLTGAGVPGEPVKKGTHRVTWDMGADMPGFHSSALSVSVHASTAMPYLVIDLSGGADAESYPVRYSAIPPNLNDDTCRTSELWLRFIQPGTFMMGSPTDESSRGSNETLHEVTLTKPFYIGVFEMTQKQWELVMGGSSGDAHPIRASYNSIRGTVNGAAWPTNGQVDSDSVMGKLRAKTFLITDLPTEAQWEYACRAGTTAPFNSGKGVPYTNTLAEVGYGNNGYNVGSVKVGSYLPNAWGLYDMHGNVMEWCLDRGAAAFYDDRLGSPSNYSSEATTNPAGVETGSFRVVRGGDWCSLAAECRSASRASALPSKSSAGGTTVSYSNGRFGLRIVVLPAVQ